MKMPQFLKPLDIQEEKEAILREFQEKLQEKGIKYQPLLSDDYSVLIHCILYRMSLKIDELNAIIAKNYLNYSEGLFLDELVSIAGIKRFKGDEPLAKVNLIAKDDTFIPKGSKFVSSDGAEAFAIADYNIKKGNDNPILLRGNKTGKWDCDILEIKDPLISKIEVLSEFSTKKQAESDEELKKRFLNSLYRFSTAGNAKSYLYYASNDYTKKLKIQSKNKGEVEIIYYGSEGAEEKIQDNLKDNVPLTDKVILTKAKELPFNVEIFVLLKPNADFAYIGKMIEKRVREYFATLEIGQTAYYNKLIALSFVDPDILDIEVQPFEEIQEDQIYDLQNVTIRKMIDRS